MAQIQSSWFIAELELQAIVTFSVNGTDYFLPAGGYYLWDPDPARSLITQLELFIQAEVPTATLTACKDRYIRADGDGNVLTLGVPLELQGPLGFPAFPNPSTLVVGASHPDLLWSAGWPARSIGSPTFAPGHRVYDRRVLSSPSGGTVNVYWHHYQTLVSWAWQAISPSRSWQSESTGGFVFFNRQYIIEGAKILWYEVTEDSVSPDPVIWPTPQGPYIVTSPSDWWDRFDNRTDGLGTNLTLEGILTSY